MIFTAALRLGLGVLFIASGASKCLRTRSVERMVANYRLVPRSLIPLAGKLLASSELAAGALLATSLWLPTYPLAWTLACALLAAFSIAIASALARGIEIPCGCGLFLNGHVITSATLVRNLALLSLLTLDLFVWRSARP